MGFKDVYVAPEVDAYFITTEEKAGLADSGTEFIIKAVAGPQAGAFGPEYVLTIVLDGEERGLSFASDSGAITRNSFLTQLQSYYEGGGDVETVVLTKVGKGYYLETV
jgi:hypothetical protein